MLNKKALWVFLSLTFALTLVLIIIARLSGFSLVDKPALYGQMAILVAMFVPGLSAIFTQKIIVKKPLKELGLKIGPWPMYAKTYGLIVLVFAVNYVFTWAFILKPDFTLASFLNQFGVPLPLPMPAATMIAAFAAITFIAAPIFNLIPSLGEEIGWRGFLLPALEPLGKTKAVIFSGMVWALWHTPMILILGFLYGRQMWLGALLHFVLVTSLGIWMGHIWLQNRSTVLSAFIHAVFNANAYGVWTMVFVSGNKLVVGPAGAVGVALCLILGVATIYKVRSQVSQIAPVMQ
jgi:uncharacterized protein